MPILALGPNGRLYQTSRDRADGMGYSGGVECADQQDLTLGSAYLKAQDARRRSQLGAYQQQKLIDAWDAQRAALQAKVLAFNQAKAARQAQVLTTPAVQNALTHEAVKQGCTCEYNTEMGGNVMTANGQSGWRGMSRDQRTIHHALTGMGANNAFRPDPNEVHQYRMKQTMMGALRLRAKR